MNTVRSRNLAFVNKVGNVFYEGDRVIGKRHRAVSGDFICEHISGVIRFYPERGQYRLVPDEGNGHWSLLEFDHVAHVGGA